jgi:hypothetical protein
VRKASKSAAGSTAALNELMSARIVGEFAYSEIIVDSMFCIFSLPLPALVLSLLHFIRGIIGWMIPFMSRDCLDRLADVPFAIDEVPN